MPLPSDLLLRVSALFILRPPINLRDNSRSDWQKLWEADQWVCTRYTWRRSLGSDYQEEISSPLCPIWGISNRGTIVQI